MPERTIARPLLLRILAAFLAAPLLSFTLLPSPGAASDLAVFNTQSLRCRCPFCIWARRCTKNGIRTSKTEAVRQAGAA